MAQAHPYPQEPRLTHRQANALYHWWCAMVEAVEEKREVWLLCTHKQSRLTQAFLYH